jgi:hypothetical protein
LDHVTVDFGGSGWGVGGAGIGNRAGTGAVAVVGGGIWMAGTTSSALSVPIACIAIGFAKLVVVWSDGALCAPSG